ncbi:MAG: homocysteine S-methyltransferase family protein [Yoonia sp.]|uniref:homocysteine S-methyltransferase family protein n=1 Tax=Yoonia sp. TaxID=2212373 RepID=UPI003267824C
MTRDIILLDGGMGQELVHRTDDKPTPLWSTHVMSKYPGLVGQVHTDYFDAGATIATTNTYAIHRDRLVGTELENDFEALIETALKEATDVAREGTQIAGAIGPLVASYRPDIHPDHDTAVPLYAEVAELLKASVDLIICETVASVSHTQSVLAGAMTAGKPVWMAFTLNDQDGTKLRSGEPLADAIAVCGNAAALLANCSAPEALDAAMPILAQSGKPFGGYANAFTMITKDFLGAKPTVDALEERKDMGPDAYAAHVMNWVAQGATIVGGCCEVGPNHIQTIADKLREAGHRIV